MLPYVISFFMSLCYVFLKGWQHQNINNRHLLSVVLVSYLMCLLDALMICLIIKSGWTVALVGGIGASIGMLVYFDFHDKVYKGVQ